MRPIDGNGQTRRRMDQIRAATLVMIAARPPHMGSVKIIIADSDEGRLYVLYLFQFVKRKQPVALDCLAVGHPN